MKVNFFFKHSRVKQYLKEGRALRHRENIHIGQPLGAFVRANVCKVAIWNPQVGEPDVSDLVSRVRRSAGGVHAEGLADELGIQAGDEIDKSGHPAGSGFSYRPDPAPEPVLVRRRGAPGPGASGGVDVARIPFEWRVVPGESGSVSV